MQTMVLGSTVGLPQLSLTQWIELIARSIRTPFEDWDPELYRHLAPSIHGAIPKIASLSGLHAVPGRAIQAALHTPGLPPPSSSALRLQGVLVEGGFRLSGVDLPRITLDGCVVRGTIDLSGSRIHGPLVLTHCSLEASSGKPALNLREASCGTFHMNDIDSSGTIEAYNAKVEGDISIASTKIAATRRLPSLRLTRANVHGGVWLNTVISTGTIDAGLAKIQGAFRLQQDSNVSSTKEDCFAVDLRHLACEAILISDITSNGGVSAFSAATTDEISLRRSTIKAHDGCEGILLAESSIGTSVYISQSDVEGPIDLSEVNIRGQLICGAGTTVKTKASGVAIDLGRAEVAEIDMHEMKVTGSLYFERARISGSLSCEEMTVTASGAAMTIDNSRVSGDVYISDVTLHGRLDAVRSYIDGTLSLTGASKIILPDPSLNAIDLSGIKATSLNLQGIYLSGSLKAENATISHDFYLSSCKIRAANVEDSYSIYMKGASIGRNFSCVNGELVGAVAAGFAKIRGRFSLHETRIHNDTEDVGLELVEAEIHTCYLDDLRTIGGVIAHGLVAQNLRLHSSRATETGESFVFILLSHSTLGNLELKVENDVAKQFIDESIALALDHCNIRSLSTPSKQNTPCIPALYNPTGMKVESISGFLSTERSKVAKWLNTAADNTFAVGTWRNFAALYDSQGLHADALWLRRQAAAKATKAGPWRSRPLRYAYGVSAGYGYRPWLALPWIVMLIGIAWAAHGVFAADFHPSNPTYASSQGNTDGEPLISGADMTHLSPGYPKYSALGMALSSTLPGAVINTFWATTNPSVLIILAILRVLSWGLAALLLAGVTGILRKD